MARTEQEIESQAESDRLRELTEQLRIQHQLEANARVHEPQRATIVRDDGTRLPEPLTFGTADVAGSYRLPSTFPAWLVLHRPGMEQAIRRTVGADDPAQHADQIEARTRRIFEDLFLDAFGMAVDAAIRASHELAVAQTKQVGDRATPRISTESVAGAASDAFRILSLNRRKQLASDITQPLSNLLKGREETIDPLHDAALYLSLQRPERSRNYRDVTLQRMADHLGVSFDTVTDRADKGMRMLKRLVAEVAGEPLPRRPELAHVEQFIENFAPGAEDVRSEIDGEVIQRRRLGVPFLAPAQREAVAKLARYVEEFRKLRRRSARR